MPNTQSTATPAEMLDKLPIYVKEAVQEAGINLIRNHEALIAVYAAYRAQLRAERSKASHIPSEARHTERKGSLWTVAVATAVIGVISALLTSALPSFLDAVHQLLDGGVKTGFLISPAFAEAGGMLNGQPPILPIFIYGIYVLFSLAYLVSLFGMFLPKDERVRNNANEVFKNLNAFFIGALSGKLVT